MRERMRPEEGGKTMGSTESQSTNVVSTNAYATQEQSRAGGSGSTCRECDGTRWVASPNGEWKLCSSCGDVGGNEGYMWTANATSGAGVDQCAEMQMEFAYENWEGGGGGY